MAFYDKGGTVIATKTLADKSAELGKNNEVKQIETKVVLCGSMNLEIWDPMNGQKRPVEQTYSKSKNGQELTTVLLKLDKNSAVFYVQKL